MTLLYDFEEIEDGGVVYGYSVSATEYAKSLSQLVIPDEYKGKPVIAIASEGFADAEAKSIVVPQSVEIIYDYAFYHSKLESITIPDSVTQLGSAFYQCYNLVSAELGNGVQEIIKNTFRETSALEWVTIGSGVKSIGDYAFYLSGIKSVVIPDNVMDLGTMVFYQCASLKSVEIGNGAQTISGYAFGGTTALESIIIGSGVRTLEDYAFYKSGIKSVVIPDNVEEINKAFYNVGQLESVRIGNGVTDIPQSAFSGCASLKDVEFGANVESVRIYAFRDCTSLNEIKLEGKISTIESSAFLRCSNLYSVTLGENLTSLGSSAFLSDYKLIEVCNKSSIEIDNISSFDKSKVHFEYSINLCSSEDGKGEFVTTQDGYVFYSYKNGQDRDTYLMNYEGDATQLVLPSPQSLIFSSEAIENYKINRLAFYALDTITDVVISDGITEILPNAFRDCTQLEDVKFGKDLIKIRTRAFQGCKISTLVIPEQIEVIEIYAFADCTSLKRIEWNAINCAALDYADINVSQGIFLEDGARDTVNSVETIIFGDKVQTIPAYTFRYMQNVTSITIPASVTCLERNAFHKSGLTSVTFAVTTGWSVTNSTWGADVVKTPNFSDMDEILEWLTGDYTSSTTWVR